MGRKYHLAAAASVFLGIGVIFIFLFVSGGSCSEKKVRHLFAIGMNLSQMCYWTREIPFVDVAKASMPWVTQNAYTVEGGRNPWHTGVLDSIPTDEDGYPLYLPVEVKGTEAPQITATLMCHGIEGHYPAGRYTCLYDGTGDIRFFFDATEVHREPGRIELDVKPSNAGILMKIVRSEKGDHIRNVRVIMPGHEDTYVQRPFNPLFLERLRPFKVIRFMLWQRTNDSILATWEQRTKPSAYTQAGPGGVAVEYMVRLCNELGADPWFCMPHQAHDGFISEFARLVKASLRHDRKIYVEYSNEVWNPLFPQYRWVEDHGDPSLSHARKYAAFAKHCFEIWQREFGNEKYRIVRVVSGQQAKPSVMEDIMGYLRPGDVDAIATSGYFGLGDKGYKELNSMGQRATDHDVLRNVYDNMRAFELPSMERHAKIAERHSLPYILYEAGPSICPQRLGVSPPYQKALWDAQRSPELSSIYREFIAACRTMNVELFMAFTFVSAQETPYGSWGHLGYLDQPVEEAPKFQVLMEEIHPHGPERGERPGE